MQLQCIRSIHYSFGVIYQAVFIIQQVAQSADGPCKARSHCPWHCGTPYVYPLAVKDSYYLIQSPTLILDGSLKQEHSRCDALESCLSAILTGASPLVAGVLILHHTF